MQASAQHLRLTLESSPVGTIEIAEKGIVESIDESTAGILGFTPSQLQGKSIATLFEDCPRDFLELLEDRRYGALYQATFLTRQGHRMVANLVLEPALQSHKLACSVIFMPVDVSDDEREQCLLDDGYGETMTELAAKNTNLSSVESAILLALTLVLICSLIFLAIF